MKKQVCSLSGEVAWTVWQCITRREYLKQFAFRENCVWEDVDFVAILFASCNTLRCIPFTAYYYRIREGSASHTSMTAKKILDYIAIVNALDSFIKEKRLPRKHFVRCYYDGYIFWGESVFLRNKEIVEKSQECKNALKHITPIVRRIMRRVKFKRFCQMTLIDKLYIIYLIAKKLFARIFAKK